VLEEHRLEVPVVVEENVVLLPEEEDVVELELLEEAVVVPLCSAG
jgi:hypothetical protein